MHCLLPAAEFIPWLPHVAFYGVDVSVYTMLISICLKKTEDCIDSKGRKIQIFFFNTGKSRFDDTCNIKVPGKEKYVRLSIQLIVNGAPPKNDHSFIYLDFPNSVFVQADEELAAGKLCGNKYFLPIKDTHQGSIDGLNISLNFLILQNIRPNGTSSGYLTFRTDHAGFLTKVVCQNKLHIEF